jgi:hypothetical protein
VSSGVHAELAARAPRWSFFATRECELLDRQQFRTQVDVPL